MILAQLLGFFVLASIIGFGIDTTLRSVRRKRFAPIRKLPFSPLYGTGAFALLALPGAVEALGWPAMFLYYSLVFCTLEYVAGALILRVRGARIWDYRQRHLNLQGHTDAFHFVLWGTVGVVCKLYVVGPVAGLVGLRV